MYLVGSSQGSPSGLLGKYWREREEESEGRIGGEMRALQRTRERTFVWRKRMSEGKEKASMWRKRMSEGKEKGSHPLVIAVADAPIMC